MEKKNLSYYLANQKYYKKFSSPHKVYFKSSICGDINKIYFKIKDNIIEDISYEIAGCALNIATLEIICDFLIGKNILEIEKLNLDFLKEKIDFSQKKIHCVDLSISSFKTFLKDFKQNL